MCEMADAAKTLGQELGDLHDLAFFRNRLEAEEGCRDDERIVLLGLICTRESRVGADRSRSWRALLCRKAPRV